MPGSTVRPQRMAGVPMSGGYSFVTLPSSRTNNLEGCPGHPDTTNFRTSDLSPVQLFSVNLDKSGETSGLPGMRGMFPVTSTNHCPRLHITTR
jgi:hypothetical protein